MESCKYVEAKVKAETEVEAEVETELQLHHLNLNLNLNLNIYEILNIIVLAKRHLLVILPKFYSAAQLLVTFTRKEIKWH
jgi:hypothetical protein